MVSYTEDNAETTIGHFTGKLVLFFYLEFCILLPPILFKGKSSPLYSQFLSGLMVPMRAEALLYPGEQQTCPCTECCDPKALTSWAALLWTCLGTAKAAARVARCGAVPWSNPRPKMGEMNYAHLWVVGGGTPRGQFSFSSHGAHKFTFKPSWWKKKSLLLVWWWTGSNQGRLTGASECTHKVRKNVFWLLQVTKEPKNKCVQVGYSSMLARCNVIEETRCLPGPMF